MSWQQHLRQLSTLQIALGISIAVHAALLTVRVVAPAAFDRIFEDTPLEVILVNAKGKEAPEKAQAVAQTSLAGGGDANKGRATSPLPYSALTAVGDDTEDAQKQMDQMLQEQNQLLTQVRRQLAVMPEPDPHQANQSPEGRAQEEKRRQLIRLLAEIEKRVNEENARPRKRYISPATREEVYALYYDGLRRRIEEHGTTHFPQAAGKKLYGDLTMVITVNHDGRVLATEVAQSSGQVLLDRRAQAIVRALAFGPFNDAMRRRADQIVVVSRFRFTRDETLNTTLSSQ